jgi:hypothetical protein
MWPEQLGPFTRGVAQPAPTPNAGVWEEYGLAETEQAQYTGDSRRFTASAWRFRDPTGAMAAFDWQRPAGATPSPVGQLAAETQDTLLLAFYNYLFRFEGWKPDEAELAPLLESLSRTDQSSLPTLPSYVPAANRVPNSERYVLGPASLELFDKRIPPSIVAFHMGAEGQITRYSGKGGELTLGVFSYPTPNMARDRESAFREMKGALVKRSGPLVAVILSPPDADEAERLLAKVQYQATITWSERMPTARDNIGNLILAIFSLTGLLVLFAAAAGLAVGGFRVFARRYIKGWEDEEPLILLRLDKR